MRTAEGKEFRPAMRLGSVLDGENPVGWIRPDRVACTALSKVAGLVDMRVIAAAFGSGGRYDALQLAYVLPGFLLIMLGVQKKKRFLRFHQGPW